MSMPPAAAPPTRWRSERYPNGMLGAIIYGRVHALHQLGRRDDAVAALAEAGDRGKT